MRVKIKKNFVTMIKINLKQCFSTFEYLLANFLASTNFLFRDISDEYDEYDERNAPKR